MLMVELTSGRERTAPGPGVWEKILKGSGVKGGVGESGAKPPLSPTTWLSWFGLRRWLDKPSGLAMTGRMISLGTVARASV